MQLPVMNASLKRERKWLSDTSSAKRCMSSLQSTLPSAPWKSASNIEQQAGNHYLLLLDIWVSVMCQQYQW